MAHDRIEIKLSGEERHALLQRCVLTEAWRTRLTAEGTSSGTLLLTPAEVESLRGVVADRLQVAGFDKDWGANDEGRLLEGIIDKLIPRKGAY